MEITSEEELKRAKKLAGVTTHDKAVARLQGIGGGIKNEAQETAQEIKEPVFEPQSAKLVNSSLINIYFKNSNNKELIVELHLNPSSISDGKYWMEYQCKAIGFSEYDVMNERTIDQIKEEVKKRFGVEVG